MFIVTIILSSPLPVKGDFNEDFTSSISLDDWTLYAWEYADSRLIGDGPDSWTLSDGALNSTGETMDHGIFNFACQETGIKTGNFTFDFYGPDNLYRAIFRIARFPVPVNDTTTVPIHNSSNIQIVFENGLDINAEETGQPPAIVVGQFYTEDGINFFQERGSKISLSENQILGWHTYSIQNNNTHVYVSLDGTEIMTRSLYKVYVAEYDSICLMAEHGTGVMFDNIRAYEIIDEPESSTDDGPYPQYSAIIALVSLSVFGTYVPGRYYLKKKD